MASTTATSGGAERVSARVHVQKFGTFLSNMIMPNIGAIIAWGLLTAFFIPVGWTPNERVATIVGPAITYLLPILIAYTGGFNVYGVRGGVVGAFGVMGVIMATSDPLFIGKDGHGSPMFLGAMIMGPLTAWTMKKIDSLWDGKIKPGFEMLVNNFAAGIWAMIMSIAGMFLLAPVVRVIIGWLGDLVNFLVSHNILPLTSIVIEPAKVFFLNNAINHGVLTPLGIQEASGSAHKSVLFLLEANPGPGLGLLLAYMLFGRGMARASAPGAAIIHFLGGIHEIYFPYVLAKPKLIAAVVLGGMTGVFTNVLFHVGLRAPAAPGSIIAVYAQTAGDSYLGVTLSWILAAAVTFLVAAFLLRTDKSDDGDLTAATAQMEANKGKKSSVASALTGGSAAAAGGVATEGHTGPIHKIVFACDAGMGSSAMGASVLRRKVQAAGHQDVTVVNKAISTLGDEWDLVVTHQDLTDRARQRTGSAVHVSVDNFMNSPRYDEIVDLLERTNRDEHGEHGEHGAHGEPASVGAAHHGGATTGATAGVATATSAGAATAAGAGHAERADHASGVLGREGIELHGRGRGRDEAIEEAGRLLVAQGSVDESYVASMHEREQSVSTYMGNLLAIPHGTNEAKGSIRRTAMSFVRYADPIDWNGNEVKFVVGIAGAGDDHLALLAKLAQVFLDEEQVARLEAATSADEVEQILSSVQA
ncbi:PTS mannitol transporter subunit IICBA [Arsenicicoccus sp. oral taxon 190]|uniref:PTS mannitol transporter subunit IICBA n=1 Tax=Arsenicicoccus sp. oral taxon 190 TaxID=1658671 RepID=UPI000679EC63|nr:PTS mannitol transporter subunit IICBA [Arsenicicoccus sp. oral taxon 190]AKT50479.1 PTS mannose transporter subunit IIA [Arsenicicoccus sp. oral taxon 190]